MPTASHLSSSCGPSSSSIYRTSSSSDSSTSATSSSGSSSRGVEETAPPTSGGPPPPLPVRSLRRPLLLQPAWSLVNRVHGPMTVARHLCSITCNKKEKQDIIRNRCKNEQNIIIKNIVIHVLELYAKMSKT